MKETVATEPVLAFFYQVVGGFIDGVGTNAVRIGSTIDGENIQSTDVTALEWDQGKEIVDSYGDPVFSYLPNGNWTLTSWSTQDDPRGAGAMLYWEGVCPVVDDDEVVAFTPSSDSGCETTKTLQIGKTSQVFAQGEDTYVFHSTLTGIHLAHLSDATHAATELEEMCVLPEAVEDIEDLGWGESTPIVAPSDTLVSDSAMAQRADGTWVLFYKGIEKDNECEEQGGLCELCARAIYRMTSEDLVNWSEPEQVMTQASVPEATQTSDGTVWLYYQDFSSVCESQNLQSASTIPISGIHEVGSTFKMSSPIQIEFLDEEFETNKKIHYATNGNPIFLPNAEAQDAFEACLE